MATVVKAKKDEPADSVIRRFKKKVLESQILTELKKREYYIKPSEEKKERKKELEKKRRRYHF
jgi:small subunit ribosomal protein S21